MSTPIFCGVISQAAQVNRVKCANYVSQVNRVKCANYVSQVK